MVDTGNDIIRAGIGLSVIGIILYWVSNSGYGAEFIDVGDNFIAVFGWVFFTALSLIYFLTNEMDMLKSVLGGAFIGVGFSSILAYMYNNNILFDTVIVDDILLWEVEFFIIILWVFVGVIRGSGNSNGF